ncbi:hypothetical protein Kpol_1003p7 [Vanderwaltozyma polyspora DSM 70294]|uniref:Cell morphogenesis protein PAG1 n=1 Tax=Vanderwaltozyma polyspora (strain ATCC 22028 / DSM 70294 / BCRC 21397 / CBS 2163 / NBRC 10782 / NRRL Y-8283 / UCD 57-17) TaxID=436907 RepID=A7TLW5_VANPO|nr:uncharacterized protein Kpol_1003p7 [Vanderwaltozyma polyspora DSM 70294]EDO16702.1 hypothetical protein Kpol_1003p7 [Vanderwaltozyma polyspora DSM 70294]
MNSAFTFPPQGTPDEGFKIQVVDTNNDNNVVSQQIETFQYPAIDTTPSIPIDEDFVNQELQQDNGINMSSPKLMSPTINIPTSLDFTDNPTTPNLTSKNEKGAKFSIGETIVENKVEVTSTPEHANKSVTEAYVENLRHQMATDWKSPSEYALHILFTKFVRHAETKLNLCLKHPVDSEPPIVDILGEGVDLEFDKIIESLGHIAKNKPKPVIDAMMFWRKTKSEIAIMAAEEVEKVIQEYELEQNQLSKYKSNQSFSASSNKSKSHKKTASNTSRFSHQRNKSSKSSSSSRNGIESSNLRELESRIEIAKETAFQADRKSLISIYLLCRVLIDIVKQAPEKGEEELNDKLEEIVFTQLKTTDPISISSSIIKSSNWNAFAELLGYMSEKKFVSVSDRFISDLEKLPPQISGQAEPGIHLLILGMRYIKLKNYPLEKFEETAEFMRSIAKFFSKTTNISVKLAYAEVINQLLLPLTGSLSAEVNHPIWVETVTSLLNTAIKLQNDNKYWLSGFKLTVSILCASPPELFTKHWYSLIEKNANTIKTRSLQGRITFATGLSRLVWVYLYRCPETLNNTTRRLQQLLELYVSGQKKKENWITTDLELINPLCDVLVTIGHLHPNIVLESAMLPLIKQSFNGSSLNNISYEKLILVINTYKGLLLTNVRPEFPENEYRYYDVNLNDISVETNEDVLLSHEEITTKLYRLFLLLDSNIGSEVWSPENEHQKQSLTQFGPFSFSFSNDTNNNNNRNLNIALFATLIETIPCCVVVSGKIPFKSAIEILSRNAVHADLLIATSSQNALKALATKENPYALITWFAKYSFDFDEKTQSRYNLSYLTSNEYKRLLVLYVELLGCWIEEFQSSKNEEKIKETGLDGIHLPLPEVDVDDANEAHLLQWKNTAAVIEEVEGNGLFFLCANDSGVRMLAIRILRIISKFDEVMVQKTSSLQKGHSRSSSHFAADRGTRLIDLLNNADVSSLIYIPNGTLNTTESSRLSKLTLKFRKGLLIKLAESEYSVDTALWMRAFPKLLSQIFIDCPVTMALCRSIVCVRLVQMHDTILKIANDPSFRPDDASPEIVTEQWKIYLIVACTFLTSTNNQRLLIPPSNVSTGKKKSQQIFTVQHQKIKSATSIFKMVLPLLNSKSSLIKDSIIIGLSSMNVNIYRAYIESVTKSLTNWKDNYNNQMKSELFQILSILSKFLKEPVVFGDKWIFERLSEFLKSVKQFLQDDSIQYSYEYQPLRIYFTELLLSYYNVVKDHEDVKQLFPFQARTSCFNFLKEWCGYGEHAYIGENRYSAMVQRAENSTHKAAIMSGIEIQKGKLEHIALETMVALCSSPIVDSVSSSPDLQLMVSFDTSGLLSWIESLFASDLKSINKLGVCALEGILESNKDNVKLYKEVLSKCLNEKIEMTVSIFYYTTLCKSLLRMDTLLLEEHELASLGLLGIIADEEEIRSYAVELLSAVETKIHNSSFTKVFKERLSNSSKMVFKSTAKEISSMYAELLSADLCMTIFSNIVKTIDVFSLESKKDILTLLVPWVNKLTVKGIDDFDTIMILQNMFYLTIKLNDSLPENIEQLWISFGKGNSFQNIPVTLDYIITSSIVHRNPIFVQYSRDVVLYLSHVPGSIGLIDSLLDNLQPKSMIPTTTLDIAEASDNGKYSFVADIWDLLDYTGGGVIFSKAQLSIIFLASLLATAHDSVLNRVPTLLHVAVCLLDHYVPLIQESASRIVCDLIFSLAPVKDESEKAVGLLRDKNMLWSYDNLIRDKSGARSPKKMDLLIRHLISIFSGIESLQIDWQRIALKWATTCSVRHVACRSFQIFRSLLTFIDQDMLRDMIHRLSNTIADENTDIQGFAMQILMTLNAITAELEPANLIDFPQLFWSITACLNSVHELEFIEVLSCFSKFISKIDLDSPDTVQCLVAIFPSNWEGRFDGLQQIVMTGLRSSNSMDITWKFLDKLNLLKNSRIIANSESRLLFALVANLPRFLNAMDNEDFTNILDACESLISLANANEQPSLARVVDSLSKNKFRSKRDFLSQIVNFITRNYFPKYTAQTIVFLLGLLLNRTSWIKLQTMKILKYILPLVDFNLPEFTGVGADLISPLLRLLLTEYETQALEVLDCIPNISGSKMDKDVLRISMGNKDLKNGTNAATTIFGIPEDSGWSVPMPGMTAATTRHNVHAVFTTFARETDEAEVSQDPPHLEDIVEFHVENDYNLRPMDTSETISIAEENDASLSHMWAELDNLDSFFTKNTMNTMVGSVPQNGIDSVYGFNHDRSASMDTTKSTQTSTLDSAPQLYDKKVSAILNRSLMRTPSSVSFKTSLVDSFTADKSAETGIPESLYSRSPMRNQAAVTPDLNAVRSRTSQLLKSPNSALLSSSKSRPSDSPQDTLFRFEGFSGATQRNRRKWQYHQQHQQLMSQTIHEQSSPLQYESDSTALRIASSSPSLGLSAPYPYGSPISITKSNKEQTKQGRSQKHYHLPHFSSNKAQNKLSSEK